MKCPMCGNETDRSIPQQPDRNTPDPEEKEMTELARKVLENDYRRTYRKD